MHTFKDDYMINTLRFVSAKEATQIYGAILPESLTSPEMKEANTYKTYLGFATGATPPKKARKFKKPASPQLTTALVSSEEPMKKSKKVKRSAKKFTKAPARGVVIRETPEMPLSKKKEKVDVAREEDGFVRTLSKDSDEETKISDNVEGDEDEEMDYTTSQLYDDVDIRLHEPVDADEGFIQKEGIDAEITNTEVLVNSSSHLSDLASKLLIFLDIPHTDAEIVSPMDVYVHHEVPSQQKPTLLIVHVSVITDSSPTYSTVILQALPSFTPPPQQSTPITPPTTEATVPPSILPNFASSKCLTFSLVIQIMVTKSLKHANLAKESSQPRSSYEAAASFTEFKLKKNLIDKIDKSESYLAGLEHRRSRTDKDKDKDPSTGSDRWLKKRETSKDAEPTKGPKAKESQFGSSKGTQSQSKSSRKSIQSEEPEFEVADSYMLQDQKENPGNDDEEPKEKTFDELMSTPIDFSAYIMNGLKITNLTQETMLGPAFRLLKGTRTNYAKLEYDIEECYKALSEKLDWENLEGGDYPFDLTKPLPLVKIRNRQKVSVDYFFNNDLKYLQGGILTMTYTTSLTKTKVAQYDLPGIKDMVPNIWSPVKVAYDKHALWGISHWKDELTQVEVIRKHGYRYLREIEVQRADNDLYTFKEGDFSRLHINDIEDISIVIQKQVEDQRHQARTTKLGIRKKDPHTPYQDPQGFICVDTLRRNMLMRLDELYKFSDGTLTRLRTSLDDITKNIHMEYLPKRRWCILEKKRANIMIKAIEKKLKETRIMRSLEKFVEQAEYDESNTFVLERFNTTAGNHVKEIILKLNLLDHMLILTDSKVTPTKHGRMTKPYSSSRFIANYFISGIYKDRHGGFFGVFVTKLATGRLVNGSSRDRIDMVIKDLNLEPKWKELSKEISSKFLPCGDGYCLNTFKLVASLIAKGKLKQTHACSFPVFTVKVKSKRYHVVPYGELNGDHVAFVARFGVISKITDRIRVSYNG
nr:hypothetical protein [Tanacetum cinerariifolium]GEW40464.1 hypothetical protein [Tanacetum cinerariifolium]